MKLAKLSLAAMVVAGLASSSFAADTLADAFKNGKVNGELRAWYFDREGSPTADPTKTVANKGGKDINSDIFNTGVVLGYVTDSFYGFKLGATFQSNYAAFADGSLTQAGTAKSDFKTDEYGSGAVLSEAYVEYSIGKTTAKIGRQFISTPLVNGSGSRMIKQSFEGAVVTNTDLPQTTLAAGVVTKYQARTDSAGNVGKFVTLDSMSASVGEGDYAYTLLAINKSIPGTTLTAQWAEIVNLVDMYYAEAAYAGKAGEFTYGLAANYQMADWEGNADEGTMYGAKLSLGFADFNTYVAYTKITDDNTVAGIDGGAGLGGGAQTAFAKAYSSKTGTYDRDTKAYSVDANYNFKQIGLLAGARYTSVSVDSAAVGLQDRVYTDIYAIYNFTGALKGLQADVSYQDWSKDVDGHDFWFKANYKF